MIHQLTSSQKEALSTLQNAELRRKELDISLDSIYSMLFKTRYEKSYYYESQNDKLLASHENSSLSEAKLNSIRKYRQQNLDNYEQYLKSCKTLLFEKAYFYKNNRLILSKEEHLKFFQDLKEKILKLKQEVIIVEPQEFLEDLCNNVNYLYFLQKSK
ncbi:hypothetical protein AB837_00519 [bacterium AB1]|nr:hypothetical protein AB837_00519 [bacterium AB1]